MTTIDISLPGLIIIILLSIINGYLMARSFFGVRGQPERLSGLQQKRGEIRILSLVEENEKKSLFFEVDDVVFKVPENEFEFLKDGAPIDYYTIFSGKTKHFIKKSTLAKDEIFIEV